MCKYPLLFSELLKCTPVADCPNSHMEVENTLLRIREATAEINKATNDIRMKEVLRKTWILQDRLTFPDRVSLTAAVARYEIIRGSTHALTMTDTSTQRFDAVSKNRIRSFGHIQLCGTLYVCWQTRDKVEGQYMVVLLYREVLCLASASRFDQMYTIQACINLTDIRIEEADNCRGMDRKVYVCRIWLSSMMFP